MDISTLITPIASFFGAALAAHLAIKRFYKEKVWERKVEAYTAIFDALHEMNKWFEVHLEAWLNDRDVTDEERAKLQASYEGAKARLNRKLDSEVWLIPETCVARLNTMNENLSKHFDTWDEMLDNNSYETRRAIKELRVLVRVDLGLESSGSFFKFKNN